MFPDDTLTCCLCDKGDESGFDFTLSVQPPGLDSVFCDRCIKWVLTATLLDGNLKYLRIAYHADQATKRERT